MIKQMTREEYQQTYGVAPTVPSQSNDSGIHNNVYSNARSSLGGRPPVAPESQATFQASATDTPIQAGLKSLGNVPRSALELGKSIGSAVIHPVKTAKATFQATRGAGESFGRFITGIPEEQRAPSQDEETFNALARVMKERFGSLDALQKTATEDPVGFGADILAVLEGGAGLVGKTRALRGLESKVAQTVTKPVVATSRAIAQGTSDVATGVAGITTGAGKESFRQALKGGEEFTKAMRGGTELTEVLNQAKGGFQEVKQMRAQEYAKNLDDLVKNNPQSYNIEPLYKKAQELSKQFNIRTDDKGALDLSRSSLVDSERQVKAIFNLLEDWGSTKGDRTARGFDILKQQIRAFRNPANPTLSKFVDEIANSAKSIASQAKGYAELEANYANYSDFLDELGKTLSLSDKATPDQAINKLNSLLRDNAEYQRILADELKKVTGKDILAPLAGKALSGYTPTGLAKYVASGVAGGAAVVSPSIVPFLALSSPRLMGEFFRLIGMTKRNVGGFLNDINNLRVKAGMSKIKEALPKGAKDYVDNPKLGMSIENVAKNIPEDDLRVMSDFTDYVAGSWKPPKNVAQKIELDASRIAERYGMGQYKSTKSLANQFGRVLEDKGFKRNI